MPNNFSVSYPELWSKTLAKNFDPIAKVIQYVDRSIGAGLEKEGDTVNVQKMGNVTIGTYTAGSDMVPQDHVITNDQLVLNISKGATLYLDDQEKGQSHLDIQKMVAGRLLVAAKNDVEDRLFTHHADALPANIIGTNGSPVEINKNNVVDYFVEARRLLEAQNVVDGNDGMLSDIVAVIDPDTMAEIRRSGQIIRATEQGDKALNTGMVNTLEGFPLVVSNRIPTISGVKNLMFFHRDFISLAVRFPYQAYEVTRAQLRAGDFIKFMTLYGSKVFNPAAGVVIKKAA